MRTGQTGSRMDFGLLSFPSGLNWPNHLGEVTMPARRFGGVGLMVQSPGIELQIRPTKNWSAQGPLAERAPFPCPLQLTHDWIGSRPLAERAWGFALRFMDSLRTE